MKAIIEKALLDAFVAGKSKMSFKDFRNEWISLNTIKPEKHSFDIDVLIKKLQINKLRGFKKVTIDKDVDGEHLLLLP